MKTITAEEAIEIMVKRIVSGFNPDKIILFGSYARGEAQSDSDIDLIVVIPNCKDRKAVTINILKSLSDLPVSKDILVTSPQELLTRGNLVSTVLYPALQEGTILYAK